ncbi:MAG: hypothetical protein R3B54_04285 [Bdellovibrionota bacterium]
MLTAIDPVGNPVRPPLSVASSGDFNTARFIYDRHSMVDNIPSGDWAFHTSSECFTSDQRLSINCDPPNLPSFIVREGNKFYMAPHSTARGTVVMSWGP